MFWRNVNGETFFICDRSLTLAMILTMKFTLQVSFSANQSQATNNEFQSLLVLQQSKSSTDGYTHTTGVLSETNTPCSYYLNKHTTYSIFLELGAWGCLFVQGHVLESTFLQFNYRKDEIGKLLNSNFNGIAGSCKLPTPCGMFTNQSKYFLQTKHCNKFK